MSKAKKAAKPKCPAGYAEKTPIKQDFLGVIKAAAQHANSKNVVKQLGKKKL